MKRLALLLLLAPVLHASELTVDRRSMNVSDTVQIFLQLDGSFASISDVRLPLRNLELLGEASVSNEVSLLNTEFSRRKTMRWLARPLLAGPASVGPVVLRASDGQVQTLPQIVIQVLPDVAAASNDPATVLHTLLANGRDPFFIIVEADKTDAYVGEQVVVTWTLYNASSVQDWQIAAAPKLDAFWAEEINVREQEPEQAYVGGMLVQKLPIRRVALYPLQPGTLPIEPLTAQAQIMRRVRTGPFDMFEGTLVNVTYSSAALTLNVKPLPPGPPVDAVGDLVLDCRHPPQQSGGPVVVEATLSGRGNVRGAATPHFEQPIAGNVQVEAQKVTVAKTIDGVASSRKWRYVIFPNQSGDLKLPPLVESTFLPATGQRQQLRCEAKTLYADAVAAPESPRNAAPLHVASPRRLMPWAAGAALLLAFVAIAVPRLRRAYAASSDAKALAKGTPAEVRAKVDARLQSLKLDPNDLLRESSDRGDAYRALRSLLDAVEHERVEAKHAEIVERVRDLLAATIGE